MEEENGTRNVGGYVTAWERSHHFQNKMRRKKTIEKKTSRHSLGRK